MSGDVEALAVAVGVMEAPSPWMWGDTVGAVAGLAFGWALLAGVPLVFGVGA